MIYVVTAVHNRYKITEAFVDRLNAQTYRDITLVLVDDGSTDGTADMVKKKVPGAVILQGDGNLWWGGALHKAYKWIRGQGDHSAYVMMANDDTSFEPDYLQKALNLLQNNTNVLLTGCGFSVNTDIQIDGVVHWNYRIGSPEGELKPTDEGNCASTRSLFMTVQTMLKIGGFHPVLLPHYASDYEWTMRASRKGIPIRSYGELVYRFDEGTTGDNSFEKITLKKLFSKRSNMNPIYRMSFILLSTPLKLLPANIGHQLQRYLGSVAKICTFFKKL